MTPTPHDSWRKETLYALRGHFRKRRPNDPEDLTVGQDDAEGIMHVCIDSRVDEKRHMKMAAGEYFHSAGAAAAFPRYDADPQHGLQTKVSVGFPLSNFAKVRSVIIIGHTHCGANNALYNALTSDTPADPHAPDNAWMLQVMPEGLQPALLQAKQQGADEEVLRRMVEQVTLLQSARNLYEYKLPSDSVKGRVDAGKLNIVVAIRGLHKDAEGNLPLLVFDPSKSAFRPIEELYQEAFPGSNRTPLEAIKAWGNTHRAAQEPASLVVRQGATSTTVGEMQVSDLDKAIAAMLETIRHQGAQR